jgi:hypothetical protein
MNLRIIIIPVNHDIKEDLIEHILPEIITSNIAIYWEDRLRNDNKFIGELGLEDALLLAVFELVLFMIVYKDERLYNYVYNGVGPIKNDEILSIEARNAARGSEALYKLNIKFNIDELIENRNNTDYISLYNEKLKNLYNHTLEFLEYKNQLRIKELMAKVSKNFNLFDSKANAMYIKEYVKKLRDLSNAKYILEVSNKLNITHALCCVGGAHREDLRTYLFESDVLVDILDIEDKINKNMSTSEIKKIISKEIFNFF